MLEKGRWSPKPDDLFSPCDSNSCKEQEKLTSDNTRMSNNCFKKSNVDYSGSELCADDTVLGDNCVVEDNTASQYSINHISQTDNELSFLDNDGWLNIGNFEDVDRMMLNCDLTFGMESLNNEEEFCWLSSAHGTEGSDDVLKSEFKFSSAEASPLKRVSNYNIDTDENIEDLPINDCKNEMQGQLSKSSEVKCKNGYLENGDSDHPYAHVEQYAALKQPFGASSSGVTSQDSMHRHRPNMDSNSLGGIQNHLMHLDNSHTSKYSPLLSTLSGSRSERDRHPSPFKESSHASNMECSHGHPLEATTLKTNDERENLYFCHDGRLLSRGFQSENMPNSVPFESPEVQEVGDQFENENEGHSEVGGVSIGLSKEKDSSNVQESSPMSSGVKETSPEAISFRQLQRVMDQLDIKTKLCIRDSLYRLAKSAEQRHNDANASGKIGAGVEARKAVMTLDANRGTRFMNVETNTNPIDRSIAHLLFHKPSDPSPLPPKDPLSFKSNSNSMTHGSVISAPLVAEKQVCEEGFSAGVEKKSVVTPRQ